MSAGAKDVTYTGKDVFPQDALDDSEAANAGQLIRSGLDIRVAEATISPPTVWCAETIPGAVWSNMVTLSPLSRTKTGIIRCNARFH